MGFDPGETARVLKARERERVVIGPSGLSYKVRRLEGKEFLVIRGGIPDLASMPLTDEEVAHVTGGRATAGQADRVRDLQIAENIVRAGLVAPAIGEAEGEIKLDDIPFGDLMDLARAISELSGITRAAAGAIRPLSDSGGSA
jgi:hypothetical protein